MTRPSRRLAALVASAVLVVLGVLWARTRSDRPPAPAAAAAAPVAPVAGDERGLALQEPSGPLRAEVPASEARPTTPEPVLRGRVVEVATEQGVEGALVGGRQALNTALLRERAGDRTLPDDVARTDAQGGFSLARIADDVKQLVATHFDYAPAAAARPPEGWGPATPVVIRVARGPHVFGTARTDAGEPAASVYVRVFGEGWPRGVGATTDNRGAYRTPAVHPGPIDLVATPPRGPSGLESGFTAELQSAVIGSLDLRVDFGPRAGHVTWRGRVLDERGEPVEAGRLQLTVLDDEARADKTRPPRRSTDIQGGAFELRKLRPAITYGVVLQIGEGAVALQAGKVRFEAPGIVERDLLLARHAILGVVVERDSGRPAAGGGSVSAASRGTLRSWTRARLDDQGRFRLRGLARGLYDLRVNAEGYAPTRREGLRVGGGEGEMVLEPIRVEVTRGASLRVRLEDCDPGLGFELLFEGLGTVRTVRRAKTDAEGSFEGTWTLLPGTWTVHLKVTGVGRAERQVALAPGGLGEALFLPGDLESFEGRVTVEGSLRRPSGEPVVGAWIFLYATDADLPDGEERQRSAQTDAQGRFRAEGFAPGRWDVGGSLADGAEVDFDDLFVPAQPPDPVILELVLPKGRVLARLVDRASGAPLTTDGPRWWAFLREPVTERVVAQLKGGHVGSDFELRFISAGHYELLLMVQGYFDLLTQPFDLGPGESRDLGPLMLEPSAVLAVEVLGPDGAPLNNFTVAVDGAELRASQGYGRAPGLAHWDGLAAGTANVTVSAEGMLPSERTLTLRAGEVTEARFELVPE